MALFHGCSNEETGRITYLIVPVAMVLAPVALVLRQPDLGTALMLVMGAAAFSSPGCGGGSSRWSGY